jgi:hypothetical protein
MPESVVCFQLIEGAQAYFAASIPYDPSRVAWRGDGDETYPVLFSGEGPSGDDLIASAFFWLSGWQEHTDPRRDAHGRFPFSVSLQAAWGTAVRPSVDLYREALAQRLAKAGIPCRRRTWGDCTWAFCATHDIDYLRKWRPGMVYREIVEYFAANRRNVSMGERVDRLQKFAADFSKSGDVFRSAFDRMIEEVACEGDRATYFIKTGTHGPNDVRYRTRYPYLLRQVERLEARSFEIGLHPSYHSHDHAGYLHQERDRLAAVCSRPPVSVRQHFLRYDVHLTPRLHRDAGFVIDSSLAFAEHEGFRRSTCHPFQIYDLGANEPLDFWEMPLCLMDGTLFNYRGLGGAMARSVTDDLIETCKRFGGVCVALWHNTLWDELDFPGWGVHFLESLDLARREKALIDTLGGALTAYFRFENS